MIADRQRLLQVLLNLVSNAIKYNHEGGRVDVSVVRSGDRVMLTVHDTGPGLAVEQVERLFVPFERLGYEHSDIEGSGVGLALSLWPHRTHGWGALGEHVTGLRLGLLRRSPGGRGHAPPTPAASHPSLTGGRP